MPRDLFGDVTRPSISIGSKKWYSLPLSLISHSAIVLLLIAIPILAPAVMPSVFANDDIEYITTILPPPPPPPAPIRVNDTPPPPGPSIPVVAPTGFHDEIPRLEPFEKNGPVIVVGDIGPGRGDLGPPPPPPEIKTQPQAVRPGFQGVRTPVKTHNVDPVYPPIAQSARIQGIVIIEATISEQGRVVNARILRSVPLLDQAAVDAVRQWEFTPTQLNGVPVPVIMTVTVNFTLSR
jgi:protein TonB